MKRLLIITIVLFTCQFNISPVLADIEVVANWIKSLQYTTYPPRPSDGAIKIHHNPGYDAYFRVVPYNSNLGVVGMLRAPVEGKLEVAERWMDWYLNHLNADGTVYDHWYLGDGTGETTSPPGCDNSDPRKPNCDWDDASDSYAATFLGAAWTYYEEGGRADFLNTPGNKEKFETIAGVILTLQQSDGLTWAKDTYRVKYLMDNSEVYWGLLSMARLEEMVFGDTIAAQTYEDAAEQVRNGIETELFNPSSELYQVAKFEDGTFKEADLNVWYPGTVAIVWPHLFGVTQAHSAIAQAQMAALNDSWDGLPNPDWVSNIVDAAGFPWTSIGHAALLTGDWDRARGHAEFVKRLKFPTEENPIGFAWPFTVDDAGWLLMTFSAPIPKDQPLRFRDNFETDNEWGIFEEIVGGNLCYGDGIGEVARVTDVASDGSYSLRVWANKQMSTYSNHAIAQKRLSYSGHTDRWRYELYTYIDPETGSTGQTGPEFSMQNTREIAPGEFRTSTAGIQYWANPYNQPGNWAVWREDTPGHASWHVFTNQLLTPGEWYYIAVEADYTTNKYGRFWLRGNGINLSINLSDYSIAQEEKFNEEAFWITLESENLWNNCGEAGVFDYKVYYDCVKLLPILCGDISDDGNITAYDASLVLQYVVGLIELSLDEKEVADVTGDSTISALDAALILQYTVGLITRFPADSPSVAPALNPRNETKLLAEAIEQLDTTHLTREQKQVLEQLKNLAFGLILPKRTTLLQNFPNPFNPETWIPYELAADATMTIRIYDVKGRLIRTIELGNKPAGIYTTKSKAAYWNGRDTLGEKVASGVYYYTLQVGEAISRIGAGEFRATRKMVILK